jgi:hypothetical protein
MQATVERECKLTQRETDPRKGILGQIWKQFWGQHLSFFQQMVVAAKVPATVRHVKHALAAGNCVVIGLQSTGESRISATMGKKRTSPGLISCAKEFLLNVITKHFHTGDAFEIKQPPRPSLVDKKAELLKMAHALLLPNNPIDELMDQLGGPLKVAEMTGRSQRLIRAGYLSPAANSELAAASRDGANISPRASRSSVVGNKSGTGDAFVYEDRKRGKSAQLDSINITERHAFQDGKKLVAIISRAASTGVSLQADKRVKNQRRRVHLTVELAWSADQSVQQMGRSHRSNQSSAPMYKLITSTIGGEWRFASAVAGRLEQLGALTQGDRKAGGGGASYSEFDIANKCGMDSLQKMFVNLRAAVQPSFGDRGKTSFPVDSAFVTEEYTYKSFATQAVLAMCDIGLLNQDGRERAKGKLKVEKFLNRLLAVPITLQVSNYLS